MIFFLLKKTIIYLIIKQEKTRMKKKQFSPFLFIVGDFFFFEQARMELNNHW